MVFNKFDTDGNKTLDRGEFEKLVTTANTTVEEFMKGEMHYLEDYTKEVAPYLCFAYACCLCTLCTSFCCMSCCILDKTKRLKERLDSIESRLNGNLL